jgi:hypothetical protein
MKLLESLKRHGEPSHGRRGGLRINEEKLSSVRVSREPAADIMYVIMRYKGFSIALADSGPVNSAYLFTRSLACALACLLACLLFARAPAREWKVNDLAPLEP